MNVTPQAVIDWCGKLIEKSPEFPDFETTLETIPSLESLFDLPAGTRVLVRADTDVIVGEHGTIDDDVRLRSMLDTLKIGCRRGWVQIVYGHRGRDPKMSLEPIASHLQKLLRAEGREHQDVGFIGEWMDDRTGEILDSAAEHIAGLPEGAVVVLENTRRYQLEQALWKATLDDLPQLSPQLTTYANHVREKLAAVHVNEGFAASNRDLSSTLVPLTMDHAVLGSYVDAELRNKVTRTREAELVVFSGIKINKLDDLEQILNRGFVRTVIAAGSLAIALLKADDSTFEIGLAGDKSQKIYLPPARIEQARSMLEKGRSNGVDFVLPIDFILGDGSAAAAIPADGAQFDIGPKTSELQAAKVAEFIDYHARKVDSDGRAAVAFHNGVFGKFEEDRFSQGTRLFVKQLKRMHEAGVEVYVGGGEGGAALNLYGDASWVTHCFTAGGTILKALGREPIPYLKALYMKAAGAGVGGRGSGVGGQGLRVGD